ncbi:hypothetical protein Amal_01626 [Acetobacter malorum]|uniref:Uncharacterized protein n=1 Tax=Acetobacter malorum TaxID=178901 RepID=A0A177G9X9_9PROT|nr:hypothetical protein Amal_01626 [Acetobacter malorum]
MGHSLDGVRVFLFRYVKGNDVLFRDGLMAGVKTVLIRMDLQNGVPPRLAIWSAYKAFRNFQKPGQIFNTLHITRQPHHALAVAGEQIVQPRLHLEKAC